VTDTPNWDIEWIMSVLPHRYPILLVDRVLEIEPKKRIVAIKNVTINEPIFNGHFPGRPVFPGVLLIEGMAQAGGLLLLQDIPDRSKKLIYFAGIEEAKFRRPVVRASRRPSSVGRWCRGTRCATSWRCCACAPPSPSSRAWSRWTASSAPRP
jgi:beta-hydroxyacyl-ACP dehydratase FabZ